MKKISLLFLTCSFSSLIFSQNQSTETILNKQKELHNRNDSTYFGVIPEPVVVDYSDYQKNPNLKTAALPAVFDMRTTGGITSVKDQSTCGSCWLFPSMGAVESRWKRLGLGDMDLSEDNLKHCHNFSYAPCQGGNRLMATAYFSRGKGPLLEAQDPYSASSAAGCPTGLAPVANVTEGWFLPNKNVDEIKQALYNYGAVYNTFFWSSKWYNPTTKVYCQTRDTIAPNNHAVLIVGWNDNIVTPLGTGAWIIKNSWGPNWGDAGFFYISYQDKEAAQDPTIWVNRTAYNAKQIFQGYDDLGWNYSIGGAKTSYGVVKFTAATNQIIKQIATYATTPNTSISAEIYSNFSGSTFSGLLGTVPVKTVQYAGYYTLDLASPINMPANSSFYVKYKIENQTTYNPLAVESKILNYTDNAFIETGKCWISTNNTTWSAIGATSTLKYDLCLKVISEASCDFLKATISQSLTNLCSGNTTTLSVSSNVTGVTYQWQTRINSTSTWTNVINSTKYAGAQTANLVVKSVTLSYDNYEYRCAVVSTCNSAYSNSSLLRVTSTPVVITHPSNVITPLNSIAVFKVTSGNPTNCEYQWQLNTSGSTWTNLVDNANIAGANTNELFVEAISTYASKAFKCRLKSSCTSTYKYTNSAVLTISGSGALVLKTEQNEDVEISTEKLADNDLTVYPNPASGTIYLDFNTLDNTHIEITMYDILGQAVKYIENNSFEAGEHTTEVNTNDIENGNYLIVFIKKDATGKILKTHKRLIVSH